MVRNDGPYGVWHWQYLHERRAGANSHKFPTYSSGGATLFDSVVVHSGSKLRTEGVTSYRALSLVAGLRRAM